MKPVHLALSFAGHLLALAALVLLSSALRAPVQPPPPTIRIAFGTLPELRSSSREAQAELPNDIETPPAEETPKEEATKAKPAPWNESQNETVLNRPVAARAIFMAISMASEPPVVKRTLPRSPGASCPRRSARATETSLVKRRGEKGRESIWALIACLRRGWP